MYYKNIPLINNDKETVKINNDNYYLTDGIFCSFNCCLAFIKNNLHNNIYNYSEIFLNQIYQNLFDNTKKIIPAPSWRLLSKFGGHLCINDFRTNFNKIEYIETDDYISKIPICKPVGFIFEKKVKF